MRGPHEESQGPSLCARAHSVQRPLGAWGRGCFAHRYYPVSTGNPPGAWEPRCEVPTTSHQTLPACPP